MEIHTPLPPWRATESSPTNALKFSSKKDTYPQGPAYRTSWRGSKSRSDISYCRVLHHVNQSVPLERANKEMSHSIMDGGVKNNSSNLTPANEDS